MTPSIMKSKLKQITANILVLLFWLLVWELASRIVNLTFILPGVFETFGRLFELVITVDFWVTVSKTMGRILLGFILGTLLGVLLAAICHKVSVINRVISFAMTVVKSTPVASFIMVLWIIVGSASLPTVIALLMVMPIIWQNLLDGYNAVSNELSEVCDVFGFSRKKRINVLVIPTLLSYFVPAALTSIGLAWKSGVAAEIIAYTKNSIGKNIHDAKAYFEGADMLAWTVTTVIISLAFEKLIKMLIRRFSRYGAIN